MEMVEELAFQLEIEDYKAMYRTAFLASSMNRTMGGNAEMKDMIGDPPRRKKEISDGLRQAQEVAKRKGINVPT